jgi:mRNA-degrading endonuclease toxin of MazEF toxin-antitoxin module
MKRGDIIVIEVPFTDWSEAKVRPAAVVKPDRIGILDAAIISSDNRNQSLSEEDIIIAAISSVITEQMRGIVVDPAQHNGTGLKTKSILLPGKIFTMKKRMAKRLLGALPPEIMSELDTQIKRILGL